MSRWAGPRSISDCQGASRRHTEPGKRDTDHRTRGNSGDSHAATVRDGSAYIQRCTRAQVSGFHDQHEHGQQCTVGLGEHTQQAEYADAANHHPCTGDGPSFRDEPTAPQPGEQPQKYCGRGQHGLALHDVEGGGDKKRVERPERRPQSRGGYGKAFRAGIDVAP